MSAEGINQTVHDLFSGSGLHKLDFVKSAVVINNDYIVNVRMVVVPLNLLLSLARVHRVMRWTE